MTLRTTRRALVALSDAATELSKAAPTRSTARRARKVATALEVTVIQLDDRGADYLGVAESFVSAAADALADIACSIGRCAHARA